MGASQQDDGPFPAEALSREDLKNYLDTEGNSYLPRLHHLVRARKVDLIVANQERFIALGEDAREDLREGLRVVIDDLEAMNGTERDVTELRELMEAL